MSTFYSLLSFMSVNNFEYSDPGSFDLITYLPLEVATAILRTLPGEYLLNAALVSTKWFSICKSDFKIRQKIKRYIRHQRRAEIKARLFGTGHRSGHRYVSNRPTMTNVANTVRTTYLQQNGLAVETSTSRYMPYRRETAITFETARVGNLRRRNRHIDINNSVRSRLRM